MKNNFLVCIGLLGILGTSYAEDVSYAQYKIMSDGPDYITNAKNRVTYVITSNPTAAIIAYPGGAETIKRIKTGTLTLCAQLSADRVTGYRNMALKLFPTVSQMQMAIQFGKAISNEEKKLYDSEKNLILFVNEADDAPYYECW